MRGPQRPPTPATCICGEWEYDEYGSRCPSCPPIRELTREQFLENLVATKEATQALARVLIKIGEGEEGCWHDAVPKDAAEALDETWMTTQRLIQQINRAIVATKREM